MRKKIIILIIFVISVGLLNISYKSYVSAKANEYVEFLKSMPKNTTIKIDIKDDIKVEKIIRQTPTNLVMLVKWGDNEKLYINIENWMTKAHDRIEIDVVDKEKSLIMYE